MVPTTSSRNQPQQTGESGTSLNKSLLTGPDLLQELIYVLHRFRQHQFALSADIEGIFLQVGVPE